MTVLVLAAVSAITLGVALLVMRRAMDTPSPSGVDPTEIVLRYAPGATLVVPSRRSEHRDGVIALEGLGRTCYHVAAAAHEVGHFRQYAEGWPLWRLWRVSHVVAYLGLALWVLGGMPVAASVAVCLWLALRLAVEADATRRATAMLREMGCHERAVRTTLMASLITYALPTAGLAAAALMAAWLLMG